MQNSTVDHIEYGNFLPIYFCVIQCHIHAEERKNIIEQGSVQCVGSTSKVKVVEARLNIRIIYVQRIDEE